MPTLSTGLIIAGAYADKVRRTLFAQLRDKIKQGEITPQEIAKAAGELNRIIYEVLVNKLRIDKGDVVRVRVDYEVENGKVVWNYKTLRIEAFKRVPDEEVDKTLKESLPEAVKKFVEEAEVEEKVPEEKAVKAEEVRVEEKEEIRVEERKEVEAISKLPVQISEAVILGELSYGGYVAALQNEKGDNVGLATIEEKAGTTVIDAVIVSEGKAYRVYVPKTPLKLDEVKDKPNKIIEFILKHSVNEIPVEDARKIIEDRLKSIV